MVRAAGETIPLPPARFFYLQFLATGVNGAQNNEVLAVKYAAGGSQAAHLTLNDWVESNSNYGVGVPETMAYRNESNSTKDSIITYLYPHRAPLRKEALVLGIGPGAHRRGCKILVQGGFDARV